ncbi:ARM repeat-containing protein [Serendipita vermifera]|nr:ARM repeat-containing protein [Serendipita vermifera]
MDPQALSDLFTTSFSPDPNTRKRAELQIRALSKEEGMLAAVMQIIGAESVEPSTRQACAVWMKNRIERGYVVGPESQKADRVPVSASDRAALKSGLLQLLVSATSRPLRLQLASVLRSIITSDFPDEWPGYTDTVVTLLSSQNPQEVFAGLIATCEPIKAFRYRSDPKSLTLITTPTFPLLLRIGEQLVANPSTPLTPEFLHLIFQSYKNAALNALLPGQMGADSIVPWGRLMLNVVSMRVPLPLGDPEEMEKHEWWKAKKWAYASLNLLFCRYGNPSQMPQSLAKNYKAFAEHFIASFAPEILSTYLEQTRLYVAREVWLSKRTLYYLGQFFGECIKPKSTWQMLKPHFETLVSSFVFPQLCFTEEKKALWRDDQTEYLRIQFEEYEEYQSGMSAAMAFLLTLAKNRTSTTFLPTLTFVQNLLSNDSTPPEQRFGALNMVVCLSSIIMSHPSVKGDIDTFLLRNVVPLFGSEVGYLRAIAAETVGALEQRFVNWKTPEGLATCYNAIINGMNDPETPVRVHCSLALAEMLRHAYVKDAVKGIIGNVIQTYLELAETTELETLNSTMDTFVSLYAEELLPVATQLTSRLVTSYMRNMQEVIQLENAENEAALEASENKMFTLAALLKTIGTIVTAMDGSPEITSQLQQLLIPIIQITLQHSVIDVLDHTLDLVDSLTFNTKTITEEMWPIFEQIYKLFKNNVIDFLEEMLPSLDNFMSYGKEKFFQRPEYCEMIVDIFETAMASPHLGEADRVNACQLIEAFLLNLRGRVDDKLARIITVSMKQLDPPPKTRSLRLANLNVLINSILYNANAAFQIIEGLSPNFSRTVFDKWFKTMNEKDGLPRVHDMKLSLMALCGLLELEEASIPPSLKDGWAGIVPAVLEIFKKLPDAMQERKRLQEEIQAEDDEELDEDEDDELILDHADDQDVYDEDTAIRDIMARESERLQENAAKLASGQDLGDGDEELDDEEIEEELGYISPLDNVDPYLAFKRSLSIFQSKNAPGYQFCTTSLSQDQKVLLTEVMTLAEQKEAEVGPVQV